MLNEYLYRNENFGDILLQNNTRILRSEGVTQKAHANATSNEAKENHKEKEKERKRSEQAVCRLEREMNAITDAELLRKARLDQKGNP